MDCGNRVLGHGYRGCQSGVEAGERTIAIAIAIAIVITIAAIYCAVLYCTALLYLLRLRLRCSGFAGRRDGGGGNTARLLLGQL